MIDIKLLRSDLEGTIEKLNKRGKDFGYLREVMALDNERRASLRKSKR